VAELSPGVLTWMVVTWTFAFWLAVRTSNRPILGSTVEVLLGVAGAFHILPELLLRVFGQEHARYRHTLETWSLDLWGLIMGGGFLAVSVGSFAMRAATARGTEAARPPARVNGATVTIWVMTWCITVSYALTGGTLSSHDSDNYVTGGLSRTLLPVISIVSVILLARYTNRPTLCLIGCVSVLAVVGSRSLAAIVAIGSVTLLQRLGVRLSWRSLAVGGAGVGAIISAVTLVRSAGLRVETFDDFETRFDKLATWSASPRELSNAERFIADVVYRLDGNSFCALMLQRQLGLTETLSVGFGIIDTATLTAMPAMLAPTKHDRPISVLNEEERVMVAYDLPDDDYLPTLAATPMAGLGPVGFLTLSFLAGLLARAADDLLSADRLASLVLLAGLVTSLLAYDQMLQAVIVQMRSTLVLVALIIGLKFIAASFRWTSGGFHSPPA
jgi:hypothetical protein